MPSEDKPRKVSKSKGRSDECHRPKSRAEMVGDTPAATQIANNSMDKSPIIRICGDCGHFPECADYIVAAKLKRGIKECENFEK